MIRLLALVQKRLGVSPGQRFRLEQWAPHLRNEHGIEIDFAPFESDALTDVIYAPGKTLQKAGLVLADMARRAGAVAAARRYDGVVLYREAALLGPAIYESALAAMGVPLFVDFDDAIWIQNTDGPNGRLAFLRFPSKIATICRLSTVVVGNEYLASFARRYSRRVFVVPTTIELADYPLQPLPPEEPFTIVWSGSLTTLAHLEHARGAIETFGARRPVVMKVIGNKPPPPFANVQNQFVPWRADEEAREIGAAHAGIMPAPEDAFARGKCALKALQYMAAGVPVVISPVGVNADLVVHDENGIHARREEHWVAAFERLAASPPLRARLREHGRATVEAGYASTIGAARFADAVRSRIHRLNAPSKEAPRSDVRAASLRLHRPSEPIMVTR